VAAIDIIREKVNNQEYEFAIPHFFEEMANDDLIFADIEAAIFGGRVRRRFTRDPRGTRYEVVGRAADRDRLPHKGDRASSFHHCLRSGVKG
jgi:hypothetical protein